MSSESGWKVHVGKVSAALHIVCIEMQPSELTGSLGLEPSFTDYTHVPASFTPSGLIGAKDYGTWCYDTAPYISSRDLSEHLRHLIKIFRPLKSRLEDFRPRPKVFVRVHYESTIAGLGAAVQIDADCLAGLAELGASLFVEIFKIDAMDDT